MFRGGGYLNLAVICCMAVIGSYTAAHAGNDFVVGGTLTPSAATSISLRFEWAIQADDNRNAAVAVSYRKKGTTEWLAGPPMVRLNDVGAANGPQATPPSSSRSRLNAGRFVGGIPNLEADTEYECEFLLYDQDGAFGSVSEAAEMRTARAAGL